MMATANSPESLIASAEVEETRAAECLYRARRNRALAELIRSEQRAERERMNEQRKTRAAATRARNVDPFGFGNLTSK